MNVTKNHGFVFLDFLVVSEKDIHNYQRLAGSYIVIKSNNQYLLCYNTLRKQWELPAGQREVNETPRECALRELYEETGQQVVDLEFMGLLKVKNSTSEEIKYNPVYYSTLEKLQPFRENNETTDIRLWDLKQPIGFIDEVDIKVFDYIT